MAESADTTAGPRRLADALRPWLPGAALLLLVAAAYLPMFGGTFLWDDNILVHQNALVRAPDGWWRAWVTTESPDYFPLTTTSFWLEWRLWGREPDGYRLTNLLLHAVSALLLWRGLRRLRVPGAWWAALLYGVHPVCVASVAWISERKNTLSQVLALAALLAWLRFEDEERHPWFGVALLGFALALTAKTSVVMLPVVLLLCAWWRRGGVAWRDLVRSAPFFALSLVMGLVTVWFQYQRAMGGGAPAEPLGWLTRGAIAARAAWVYLAHSLAPVGLTMLYPRWEQGPWEMAALAGGLVYGVLVLLLLARPSRPWRALALLLGGHALVLAPVLGLLRMAFHQYAYVSDHLQYVAVPFAATGVVAAGVWAATALPPATRRALLPAAGLVLCVLCAGLTWRRAAVFAVDARLWRDTLARNPESWAARTNLAAALIEDARREILGGRLAVPAGGLVAAMPRAVPGSRAARQLEECVRLLDEAMARHRGGAIAVNRGCALELLGRDAEALAAFRDAVGLAGDAAVNWSNLGRALDRLGEDEEAEESLRRAVHLRPDLEDAHFNLGNRLAMAGKDEEAAAHYQAAIAARPDFAEACINLAAVRTRQQRWPEALALYEKARRLRPDAAGVLINLGVVYVRQGRFPAAEQVLRDATALDPADSGAFFNLGIVLALAGRPAEALAAFATAQRLNPADADVQRMIDLTREQMPATARDAVPTGPTQ